MQQRAKFKIEGLDCAEEVAVLRKVLGGTPGVLDLEFDILNARMTVTYEADEIAPLDMIERV